MVWIARHAAVLEAIVTDAEQLGGTRPNIFIDVSQVSRLDTFGAWLIERLRRNLSQGGVEAQIAGLSANYSSLVNEVRRVKTAAPADSEPVTVSGMLEGVGRSVVGIGGTFVGLIDMLGAVLAAAGHVLIHPRSFRLTSTIHHMEQVCWRAVPIIVLITFLIGCIISQQGISISASSASTSSPSACTACCALRMAYAGVSFTGRSGSAHAGAGSMKMRMSTRTMGFVR